jgi:uncharacterized protein YpuA (DUF1002 family)
MNAYSRASGSSLLAFVGGMIAWAVFGPKIKQRLNQSHAWQELKAEIDEEVSKVRDLTEDRYHQIVDTVSDRYSRLNKISKHEISDLVDDLKKHWNKIKEAWNEPATRR